MNPPELRIEEAEVLDLLTLLIDKSLVHYDESTDRYSLLDTVRQYGRDRMIETYDAESWRDRHLSHFLEVAEAAEPQLKGSDQTQWFRRLDAEHDNLRSALAWSIDSPDGANAGLRLAGDVWRFWDRRCHFEEGRGWLKALLSHPGSDHRDEARAKALNGAAMLAHRQGENNYAWEPASESLRIRMALGNPADIAASFGNLGIIARELGDDDQAWRLQEQSLAIRRELGDPWAIALALGNLANLAYDQQDFARSRSMQEESLGIRRDLGDLSGIALSLNCLGNILYAQGEYAAARMLHIEGLCIWNQEGDRRGIAESLDGVAASERWLDQHGRSVRLCAASSALREAIGAPLDTADRSRHEAVLHAARGSLAPAAFESAFADGRAMTMEQAVEYALRGYGAG